MYNPSRLFRSTLGGVLLAASLSIAGVAMADDPNPGMTTATGKAGTGIHEAPQTSPDAAPLIQKKTRKHRHHHHHHKAPVRAAVKPG